MTMPRYQNCPHRDEGWCLACVNEVHDDHDQRMGRVSGLLTQALTALAPLKRITESSTTGERVAVNAAVVIAYGAASDALDVIEGRDALPTLAEVMEDDE